MTSHLAPESPRPWSVSSECYFRQLNGFPMINYSKKKCLFGEEYEREFCFYLAKHAEANCDDRVCLIGEESEWIHPIQERLFLNKMIDFIDCNLQQNLIEQRLSTKKFDRIILFNCLHKIKSLSIAPINLLQRSLAANGRLIVIYREPSMNTLPLPTEVIRKWFHTHLSSTRYIKQIYQNQNHNLEIHQKIETIKFLMNKLNWFSLLYHQMFYPLTLIHQKQIIDGLRRLNETYFKYHSGLVEMHEQLTFLMVQKTNDMFFSTHRSIQSSNNFFRRLERKTFENQICHSQISITEEITELFNLKNQNQIKKTFE